MNQLNNKTMTKYRIVESKICPIIVLKSAQQQIRFWKERETWKVIDVD